MTAETPAAGLHRLTLRHPAGETPILVGAGALAAAGPRLAGWLAGRTAFVVIDAAGAGAPRRAAGAAARRPRRAGWCWRWRRGRRRRRSATAERLWDEMLAAGGKRDSRAPRLRRRQRRRPRRLRGRLLPARHRLRPAPDHAAGPGGRRDRRQDRGRPARRQEHGGPLPSSGPGGLRHRGPADPADGGAALGARRGDQDGGAPRSGALRPRRAAARRAPRGRSGGARPGGGRARPAPRSRSSSATRPSRGTAASSTSATPSAMPSSPPSATRGCATARRWATASSSPCAWRAPRARPRVAARDPRPARAASTCRRCRRSIRRAISWRSWRGTRRRAKAGSSGCCRRPWERATMADGVPMEEVGRELAGFLPDPFGAA